MSGDMIPAIYANGTFQLAEPLPDLAEKQAVQLFYVIVDESGESQLNENRDSHSGNGASNGASNGTAHHFIGHYFVDDSVIEDSVDDDVLDEIQPHPLDEVDEEFVEMFGPPPETVEERVAFVHRIAGIWPVEDEELRRWLDEEVTMYNDELWS